MKTQKKETTRSLSPQDLEAGLQIASDIAQKLAHSVVGSVRSATGPVVDSFHAFRNFVEKRGAQSLSNHRLAPLYHSPKPVTLPKRSFEEEDISGKGFFISFILLGLLMAGSLAAPATGGLRVFMLHDSSNHRYPLDPNGRPLGPA